MFRLTLILIATLFCNLSFAAPGVIPGLGGEERSKPGAEWPSKPEEAVGPAGECKMMFLSSGLMLNYCSASFPNEAITRNIVYFFHGLNGQAADLLTLLSPNSPFYSVAKQLHTQAPFYISLSLGARETVPVEPAGLDPLSLRDLLDSAIPAIEKDFLFYGIPASRHLIGMSLGGHNALSVAALRPKYFKSVMAICPALINFNPFDDAQVREYIARQPSVISPKLVADMIAALRTKYVTESNWLARNPINLLNEGRFDQANLFISTGDRDEYGFNEGAEAFAQAAGKRGMRLTYAPTTGRHCAVDLASFGRFLSYQLQ